MVNVLSIPFLLSSNIPGKSPQALFPPLSAGCYLIEADLSIYEAYPQASNDGLTRDQLAAQIQAFAHEFDLDRRVLHSTTVTATTYDADTRSWNFKLNSRGQERNLSCKCVILATGAGFSGAAPLPDLPGRQLFKGPTIHSVDYRNAKKLVASGAQVS